MDDLRIKNQILTRANVKHVTKIRSLENQVKILQNELLFERMNRVPIGHIQDVCSAAIEEFDLLQEQIKLKSDKWNRHARIGLQAVIDLMKPSEISQNDKRVNSTKNCEAGLEARQFKIPSKIKRLTKVTSALAEIDENQQHYTNEGNIYTYLMLLS